MSLTEKQRKFLRGLAHPLRPCVTVGGGGVSGAVVDELGTQLEHHELIKVKLRVGDRSRREAAIADLAERSGAECVTRIGNIAVLFRARKKNPGIVLPPAGRAQT